jgi:hypothetical protein
MAPDVGIQIGLLPHRIINKIRIERNGCWIWLGGTTGKGHGKVSIEGRWVIAHRAIYKLLVDPDLPDELQLDHLCRVRGCVNPHHVEPVTAKINTERGNAVLYKTKTTCATSL